MKRSIPVFCEEGGLPSLIYPFNEAIEKTSLLSLRGDFCRSNLLPWAQTVEIASLESTRNDGYLAFSAASIREIMRGFNNKASRCFIGTSCPTGN